MLPEIDSLPELPLICSGEVVRALEDCVRQDLAPRAFRGDEHHRLDLLQAVVPLPHLAELRLAGMRPDFRDPLRQVT